MVEKVEICQYWKPLSNVKIMMEMIAIVCGAAEHNRIDSDIPYQGQESLGRLLCRKRLTNKRKSFGLLESGRAPRNLSRHSS